MSLDIFKGDQFTLNQLTASFKKQVYTPTLIQSLNLFSARGIDTTSVFIDIGKNSVNLVSASERGSTPATVVGDKYESRPFKTFHLAQRSSILAAEVQDVRLFNTEDSQAGVQMKIDEVLGKHARNLALTKEKHMLGAIQGVIRDADNSVLLDLHNEMGTTATQLDMALDVTATKVRTKTTELKRIIDAELGAVPYSSVHVICGKDFFDAFVDHPEVEKSWLRFNESANLREDLRRGFVYGGVTFEEYRGGAGVAIEDDEAWAIPMGVDELFLLRYAPADYMETVGTIGIENYSKSMVMDMDKGVTLESQSNPLYICTRPNAVVQLGLNAAALT